MYPAFVFKLVDGLHQTDVAFLDQVEELEPPIGVLLGNADDQSQVRFGKRLLGLFILSSPAVDLLHRLGQLLARGTDFLLDLLDASLMGSNAAIELHQDFNLVLAFLFPSGPFGFPQDPAQLGKIEIDFLQKGPNLPVVRLNLSISPDGQLDETIHLVLGEPDFLNQLDNALLVPLDGFHCADGGS